MTITHERKKCGEAPHKRLVSGGAGYVVVQGPRLVKVRLRGADPCFDIDLAAFSVMEAMGDGVRRGGCWVVLGPWRASSRLFTYEDVVAHLCHRVGEEQRRRDVSPATRWGSDKVFIWRLYFW
jgi:hypothetical protein